MKERGNNHEGGQWTDGEQTTRCITQISFIYVSPQPLKFSTNHPYTTNIIQFSFTEKITGICGT